uniref:ApoA-I-binding protein 2 n=1 Tax=Buteo japonicus TaxID=224669 RepID=A0A8C0BIG3_9AVES
MGQDEVFLGVCQDGQGTGLLWDQPGHAGGWGLSMGSARAARGRGVNGICRHGQGMGSVGSLGSARVTRACKAEAEAIEKELLEDYRFGRQQLIEIWGHACAVAVTKPFTGCWHCRAPAALALCGQEGAGGDPRGSPCPGSALLLLGPTIFYPKRSPDPLYRDFTTQCEKMDIPFLSYLPTEVQLINDAYNAVVDAVLGAEAEAAEGREPCAAILATLKHVRIPIVSLDVPSGWDVEAGSSGGISPDVLVSLSAPKQCARRFLGRQHFVAGRFLPYDVQKKFELNPPKYPGTECVVAL